MGGWVGGAIQHPSPATSNLPGRPRLFYHGTSIEAALKIQESGFRVDLSGTNAGDLLGPGIYCTTTLEKALSYAKRKEAHGVVLELEINLGQCKQLEVNDPMLQTWQDNGFDSAWMPLGANSQGLEENCIKDPKRIKIVNIFPGHTGKLQAMGLVISNGRLMMKSDVGSGPVREESSKNICCVCLSQPSSLAVVPCGHKCLCEHCAPQVSNCPMCRGPKQSAMKIFGK